MAQDQNQEEKIVYVGDSRIQKKTQRLIPQDYSAFPGKTEPLIPNFLLKEWMVGAVVIVGFMVLVMAHEPPLGYPADPLTTGFIPMPDWYFLFMYQLLKYPYMADEFLVFGTVIMPGLMFGALILTPFLDRGKERRFYKRPIASTLVLLTVAAIFHLTYVSWAHYQNELEVQGITPEHIERANLIKAGEPVPGQTGGSQVAAIPIVDEDHDGFQIYQKASCVSCHANDLSGTNFAPALLGVGDKYDRDEIMDIIVNGIGGMSGQLDMNAGTVSEAEFETLADWLALQKAPDEDAVAESEPDA